MKWNSKCVSQVSNSCAQGQTNEIQKLPWPRLKHTQGRFQALDQNAAFYCKPYGLNQTAGTVFAVVFSGGIPAAVHEIFPETNVSYMVRKISQLGVQICNPNLLILSRFHGSKQRSFEIQTYIQYNFLISSPKSVLNISTWSPKQDLHVYGKNLAKKRGRIFTYLNCSVMNLCPPALKLSRSSSLCLIRSFLH